MQNFLLSLLPGWVYYPVRLTYSSSLVTITPIAGSARQRKSERKREREKEREKLLGMAKIKKALAE